jgi:hypothetical protein
LRTPPQGPPPECGPGLNMEGPAMRARAGPPPWWLQEPPPHWALPYPIAAGREPAGVPWYPPGFAPQGPSQMDDLEERVVRRIVDLLGPILEARSPARGREDLREAPQGLHAGAPEVEVVPEFLLEEVPLASSAGARGEDHLPMSGRQEGHRGPYFGHGGAPRRPADLRAPAGPDKGPSRGTSASSPPTFPT